ncbi:MAG: DUF11 domain-containing protein [Methanobacterium sp.]|nr:DUF11 domain-containing protein [Methanobacterium sp.]
MTCNKKRGILLLMAIFMAVILCGSVTAADADTNNGADTDIPSEDVQILSDSQSGTNINASTDIDPIITGKVMEGSSNTGLSGASVIVENSSGDILAQTTTGADGSYSVNFNSLNTEFKVTAGKLGYIPWTKEVTVTANPNDPADPNLYGTANFSLYVLPAYSANTSSYVLNVGVIPQLLLDIYAGKSSAEVDTTVAPYSTGECTPLEITLLNGNLLAGLLDVSSTGDQGTVTGGILPQNLPSLLQSLGLTVGALTGEAYSSTSPVEASGVSSVAAIKLNLLNLIPILNLGLVGTNSTITPDFNTGALSATSISGVGDISLLGGLIQIKALRSNATAVANGEPGGASADFTWSIADIILFGDSVLQDLTANGSVEIPYLLKLSLGEETELISADGTHAEVSGNVLNVELLSFLLGGVKLTIGHAEAAVTVPIGGLNAKVADLEIEKSVDNANPNYQDTIVVTLTASNHGPDGATNIQVIDQLPFGLEWVSDDSYGAYNPVTGVWTISSLANGASAVLHIVARVVASNTQITNLATINGPENDQNPDNDQDTVTVDVAAASDLGITKTVDDSTPNYLQNVTFTLTAHNYGPDTATSVSVADMIPAGLEWVSDDSNGAYNYSSGVWTIGNLASGTSTALHIVAKAVGSNTQLVNVAVISGTNYDLNSTNNQATATVNLGTASDLGITKTVNNANPQYLDYVTFTLTAHNGGPDDAPNVKVYDTMPDGLRYVSDDSAGAFNPTTGLWSVGFMANGATRVLHVVMQAMVSNVQLTNVAYITDPDPVNPTAFYDPNPDNDHASATVDVGPATDLSVTKTASDTIVNYLQDVTFTLTAHNSGPDGATGVTVFDQLPAGLEWVSDDSNGAYNHVSGAWTIGSLAANSDAILHIVAKAIVSNTQLTNIATINGYETDQNSTDNEGNVTVIVGPASDLSISKSVSNANPGYLESVTFTLTAHNSGPNDTTGVSVVDQLPAGLEWVSDDSNGAYNHSSGVWTIGSLASGTSAVLHIVTKVMVSSAQLVNVAVISGTNYDQNSTNNQDDTTVVVGAASDLSISKSVNNTNPNYLDNVTFTLTVHNNGPDGSTGVSIVDTLPAGLEWVSDDSNGAYNHSSGVWTIGSLASGTSTVLHIVAKIVASNTQLTNVAVVSGTNPDQNPGNNQDDATVNVAAASDLGVSKAVDDSTPNYLQNVNFTLTVTNGGPDSAVGVSVTDLLPTGLEWVSDDSNGAYNHSSGVWTIGSLASGTSTALHIVAKAVAPSTQLVNVAVVSGTNYDQNSDNNQDNVTVTVGAASDLGITKTVNKANPQYLDYVTFTLTAHNYGPNDAPNVKVYDTMPDGLRYVSDDSNGSFNPTTGLWSVGFMANGATRVLHVVMQAMVSNVQLTNVAYITDPDPLALAAFYDPNPDNNQATATVTPYSASDNSTTSETPETPETSTESATTTPEKTVGMQTTGIPIGGLLLALLAIFAGMSRSKRDKQ